VQLDLQLNSFALNIINILSWWYFHFLLFAILPLLSSCVTSFNIKKCEDLCLLQTSNTVGCASFQLYIYHLAEILLARLEFVVQIWVSIGSSLFYAILFVPDFKIYITFRIYAIMFGLTRYGMGEKKVASHALCWRLAESDVTVTPFDTCMH